VLLWSDRLDRRAAGGHGDDRCRVATATSLRVKGGFWWFRGPVSGQVEGCSDWPTRLHAQRACCPGMTNHSSAVVAPVAAWSGKGVRYRFSSVGSGR
jgi:hypothetical protein